jgi:dihydropteroate synthase
MGPFAGTSNAERDLVTVGGSLALAAQGVEILRVHNIAAHAAAQLGFAHSSF